MSFVGLSGKFSVVEKTPSACVECSFTQLYKQPDFKRSLGVTFVTIASLISFILMGLGYNWFVFMSPMLLVLIIDRAFAYTRPLAMICYKCGHIHRGLSEKDLEEVEAFDLEHYDRVHYTERTGHAHPDD
jgi:hypothetical protein